MLAMLKNWKGAVEIDGTRYESIDKALTTLNKAENENISIRLLPLEQNVRKSGNISKSEDTKTEYRIKVRKYMTEKASPQFDFMAKWNNNEPMPLRIMTGTIDKETRGMVHMTLHGDMYAEQMCTCMKCGKRLTNKVSQYFGIGPECGGHNYVNPFNTDEELKQAVADYRKKLVAITWSGWIVKSAITEQEEV